VQFNLSYIVSCNIISDEIAVLQIVLVTDLQYLHKTLDTITQITGFNTFKLD